LPAYQHGIPPLTMDVVLLILRLGILVFLYGFLGIILFLLLRDLSGKSSSDEPAVPHGHLTVISSEDPAVEIGTEYRLQPLTSLGRSPQNTVTIPDSYASAWNSLLTWHDGRWWVEDRNSRNGTQLNGQPISGATVISSGDIIGVGRTHLKLELE